MLATFPIPEDLDPYYESPDYISHNTRKKGLFGTLYRLAQEYNLRLKYHCLPQGKSLHILDYGCGSGDFIQYALHRNHNIVGLEPNPRARQLSEQIAPIFESDRTLPDNTYDVITLWHVLEHLAPIKDKLERITRSLKQNGRLIIAVPNYRSYDARYYNNFWAAYDVPRHIWHFDQTSINQFIQPFGYCLIRTEPMPLDAYYVSILSEKYRDRPTNYLNAIYRGLLSNIKAKTSSEYSSLIYTFQKNH